MLLFLLLFASPAVAADCEGILDNCLYCDSIFPAAGNSACNFEAVASAERAQHWNDNVFNRIYSASNPCCIPSAQEGSNDLRLAESTRLAFGRNANLSLHFNNLVLDSNAFLFEGSLASCANLGRLSIIAADSIILRSGAKISHECGNVSIEANTIYLEDNAVIRAGDWLSIKTNRLVASNSAKIVSLRGGMRITERTLGGGTDSQFGEVNALSSAACTWCCTPQENQCSLPSKHALYVSFPAQEINFTTLTSGGETTIQANKTNFLSFFQITGGRLFVQGNRVRVNALVSATFLVSMNLSTGLNVSASGAISSLENAVTIETNEAGLSRILGPITATNQQPFLPHSHYPDASFNNTILLNFAGNAEINSSITANAITSSSTTNARNTIAENQLYDPISGRITRSPSVETTAVPSVTYEYDAQDSNYWTRGERSIEANLLANEFSYPSLAHSTSDNNAKIISLAYTPRPAKYGPASTDTNAQSIAIQLQITHVSIADDNSCVTAAEKMMQQNTLYLRLGTSTSALANYNFSNHSAPLSSDYAGHSCTLAFTADNATLEFAALKNPKWKNTLAQYDPASGTARGTLERRKYFFSATACSPTDPLDCVSTATYSFNADAAPTSTAVIAAPSADHALNYSFSAKITHLQAADGDLRVGAASAGLLFRSQNQKAYLLSFEELGFPSDKRLAIRVCNEVNPFFATGQALTSFCNSAWETIATSLPIVAETNYLPSAYPHALLPANAASYYLKITADGCNFKAYYSADGNFLPPPAIDHDIPGCTPEGTVGFWTRDSRTLFSNAELSQPTTTTTTPAADIAIHAEKLRFFENSDVRANYPPEGQTPRTHQKAGKLYLNAIQLSLVPTPSVEKTVSSNACNDFTAPAPARKPYFYANPCDPASRFTRSTCTTDLAGITDDNTFYNARAPSSSANPACSQQNPLIIYGTSLQPNATAPLASAAIWVERIRNAQGNSVYASPYTTSRYWANVFRNPLSASGIIRQTIGQGLPDAMQDPALYLRPNQTYYLDFWISDNSTDDFNLAAPREAKRHKYQLTITTT